jgi:signal transduction histidine kinase
MTTPTESHTRLRGRWLILARLAWISIAILAAIIYTAAVPVAFNLLRTPCYVEPCDTPFQTASETASAVQEQASLRGAWYHTIMEATSRLVSLGVALLIFWRRSKDWMAQLTAIMLVTISAVFSPSPLMLTAAQPLWHLPRALMWAIGLGSTVGFLYLFPDGRFVPGWTRGLTIALLVGIGILAAAGAPFQSGLPVFVVALATGAVFQVYRYRRVSNPLQRQQTKWVVLGISGMVVQMLVFILFVYLNPSVNPLQSTEPISPQGAALFSLMITVCIVIPLCFLPVTLAFSILRYRLWDVDILINRTLVYGVLTASVVGLYVLIVGGFGILFQMQNNLPGIIIAILLIAFLFQPLRRRLQDIVNRFVPVPQTRLSQSQPSVEAVIPKNTANTTWRGFWLTLARVTWIALAFLIAWMTIAAISAHLQELIYESDNLSFGFTLRRIGLSVDFYIAYNLALEIVRALGFISVAVIIFWRKSNDWMALFTSLMLLLLAPVWSFPYSLLTVLSAAKPEWDFALVSLRMMGLGSFVLFLFLFPNGRIIPRWTRILAIWILTWPIIHSLSPFVWASNYLLSYSVYLGLFGAGLLSQIYRYRHFSGPVERQQTKWVVYGFTIATFVSFAIILPSQFIPWLWDLNTTGLFYQLTMGSAIAFASLLMPISIGISILRYRLWDIDIFINRSLVYGALIVSVIGLYMIVVGVAGALFQSVGNTLLAILATGLIAVLFHPLRQRLQRGINHLMYGDRDDPYVALSRLGRRMESTLAPDAVLPTVVTTVGDVLKLPYVAIYLKQEPDGYKIIAEAASPFLRSENGRIVVPGMNTQGVCVPLIHQGETLGYIVLGPRAPNEAFTSTDLRLLEDLAPQVSVAVHAVRLTADLQRSREQLVLAREEERRRLRRDLHDDLAPTLASLGLTASTAAALISTNPTTATALVKELQTEIRATVGNIRRLVYDLRPPTLDELGLLAAVRERAAQYTNAPGSVHITVDAPAELPTLPAAVEVAAYRIVQEALENVSKHSQARQCAIRLANHNGLEIEITDDGLGLPPNITPGVGLRSMRERAEELGGSCVIERCVNGGTRLLACLPIGEFDGSVARSDRG